MAGIQPRLREQGPLVWRSLFHGKNVVCSEARENLPVGATPWRMAELCCCTWPCWSQTVAVLADSYIKDIGYRGWYLVIFIVIFFHFCF